LTQTPADPELKANQVLDWDCCFAGILWKSKVAKSGPKVKLGKEVLFISHLNRRNYLFPCYGVG